VLQSCNKQKDNGKILWKKSNQEWIC